MAESGNHRDDPDLRDGALACQTSSWESAGQRALLPGAEPNSALEEVAPTYRTEDNDDERRASRSFVPVEISAIAWPLVPSRDILVQQSH